MALGEARLFIGIALSDAARSALETVRRALLRTAGGKLCHPSLYHITLCFLGDTPRRAIPHLCALMDRLAFEPFDLTLGELGAFRNGAVLWAGLESPCVALHRLQGDLAAKLTENGFPIEKAGFTPHITLGRQMTKLPNDLPEPNPVAFTVKNMVLYESKREGGALQYDPIYVQK
jgi:2'-5' RNA ligase